MIRKPAVAGMFYPGSKHELQDSVSRLIDSVRTDSAIKNITGIISPHAGYFYSGKTAACAFSQIENMDYETVVVIAPSHREYFTGCSIYEGTAYGTPLGNIPLNTELRGQLVESNEKIFAGVKGHRAEHSIEVILPFLQNTLGGFSLLPIVMGAQTPDNIQGLSDALVENLPEKSLIVASTDLSHFYPRNVADKLDGIFERDVENYNFDELQNDLDKGACEACGGGPTIALMKITEKLNAFKSTVLNRTDSGETTGDLSEVVGYLSAVITE